MATALAGCNGGESDADGRSTTVTSDGSPAPTTAATTATSDGSPAPTATATTVEHCPPKGVIIVSVPGTVPPDEAVLDAEADGLTENEYLAEALAAASDEYEAGTATGGSDGELATVSGTDVYYSDADDLLPQDDALVSYEGVTYDVEYFNVIC